MHRTPSLSDVQMAQVLLLNQPLRQRVIYELKRTGLNTYYDYLKTSNPNQKRIYSMVDFRQMEQAWYAGERDREKADLKRIITNDNDSTYLWESLDSLRYEVNNFMDTTEVLSYYMDKGDYTTAESFLLDSLNTPNDYTELLEIVLDIYTGGMDSTGLFSDIISRLDSLASADKLTSATAAGILQFWDEQPYEEPVEEPNPAGETSDGCIEDP